MIVLKALTLGFEFGFGRLVLAQTLVSPWLAALIFSAVRPRSRRHATI